jgi:hypothetical protein
MVGLVRLCRSDPRIKENLSGGVGLVSGMKCGIFQFCADVQRAGSRRVPDVNPHLAKTDSIQMVGTFEVWLRE